MSEPSSPRSGLSPAAWAAISAIAVAVIGTVATLLTAWWERPAPPPAASVPVAAATPAAAPAAPAQGPAAWIGRWAGEASEPSGRRFQVLVEFTAPCGLGRACGTIAAPHVPCRGELTLIATGVDGFEFGVDNFDAASNAQVCKAGGGEVLSEGADGTLRYFATYSGARGVLNRQP